jgi:hypothetical protein
MIRKGGFQCLFCFNLEEPLTPLFIFQTSTAPNSWASIALWRRFFALKEKEEEEKLDELQQFFEEAIDIRQITPIAAPEVRQAREQFSQERLRDLTRQSASQRSEQEVIQQPNLQIPAGEEYLYFAQ